MTPVELKVIEAARAWHRARLDHAMPRATELIEAVEALEAERKAGPEQTVTWGQVVESDQIWSGVTKKWYKVISSVPVGDRMRIQAKGLPKAINPLASADVRVQRGATGQTMDMWNVVWSAQTIPDAQIESEVES
jgi:hypothetical protein